MSSDIRIINPLTYPKWDDLLKCTDGEVFSNSTAWVKILHESYGYTPLYFSIFEGNRLSTLIPVFEVKSPVTGMRGVSLPFTDYCTIVAKERDQFLELFNCIIAYGKERGWKYFEFRDRQKYFNDKDPSRYYYGHELELTQNENHIFSDFRNSTKRNIKRAIKEDVNIKFSNTFDSIKVYYRLHSITRKRQGVPPQPFYFFKKIHENILSKEKGLVALASYRNMTIAGAVFFHIGHTVSYKFGASDLRYQNVRANNLVMWKAIRYYARGGYKSICFGRTEPENNGLRQFKSGWGSTESIINYYKYDLTKNFFIKDNKDIKPLYNKIFSAMPVPILKMAGSLLYKHIG